MTSEFASLFDKPLLLFIALFIGGLAETNVERFVARLGKILRTKAKDAYGRINAKRVDLLLVDGECRPIAAMEYQGELAQSTPRTTAFEPCAVGRE